MKQPVWAEELILSVAKLEGRSKLPKVKWIQRDRASTSGVYYRKYTRRSFSGRRKNYGNKITICVGRDGEEKQVLIHELAHWLTRGKGHSKRFWIKCFTLLKHFNLLTEEYRKREFGYMKKASYTFNLMTEKGGGNI